MDEAAETIQVPLAGRALHRAGAEEQQALEQRMIEDVQQRRGEGERRCPVQAMRFEGERKTEADEDDADILDRAVGENALQVVLHQRVQHAEHGGDAAKREHEHAPPPDRRSEQIENDAHEGVDRDLGHHAAQQGRDVARCGGMGERQPGMQRHEARFRSGADEGESENERSDRGRWMAVADRREGIAAIGAGQQAEGEQQRKSAEAGHDEIDVAGVQIGARAVMRHHQRP